MKKKIVVFHPSIAPYRIDFFNSLSKVFDAKFYFKYKNVRGNFFNQDELQGRLEFKPNFLSSGFLGIKNLRFQVLPILIKEKPDIIFLCEYNILGFLVLLYKYLFNNNVRIFTICDDSQDVAAHDVGAKRIMRTIFVKLYNGIILTNKDVISWYTETYHIREKLLFFPIVQNDVCFRDKLNEALPISKQVIESKNLSNKQTILYVGRLVDVKNLFFLLHGLSQLMLKYPNAVLLLVGDGSQRILLEQEVQKLGIAERVLFVGKKEGLELYAYYNIGQIFVLPSYYEPFGAVVNEALLAGCYTMCSRKAGAACLVNVECLFNPYDKEELKQKIDLALSKFPPLSLSDVKVKSNQMLYSYNQYMDDFLQSISCL